MNVVFELVKYRKERGLNDFNNKTDCCFREI